MLSRFSLICILCLISLTLVVYFPGLNADFFLDDISSIVTSGYVTNPEFSAIFDFHTFKRAVVDISFFLNHQVSDLEANHFRVVNLVIHLINGCLVFYVVFKLSRFFEYKAKQALWMALAVATLFLLHPIQTQAVTYIVQRYTSLMTLFCLLSLSFYIKAKMNPPKFVNYSLAFVFFVLAVLSKETALVLVLVFVSLEWVIGKKQTALTLLLWVGLVLLLVVQLASFLGWLDLSTIDRLSRDDLTVSRVDYFKAQQYTIFYYLQSTFNIFGGYHLEYDETVREILSKHNWAGFILVHVLLIFIAVRFKKHMPLFSLGIASYYCALSLESSFLPIRDVIVEHRTYFPNLFLFMAIVAAIGHVTVKLQSKWTRPIAIFLCLTLCSSLSYATYNRNGLWSDKVKFYQNELKHSPNHWRIKNALVVLYMQQGKEELAKQMIINLIRNNQGLHYPPVLINGILLFQESNPTLAKIFEKQMFSEIRRLSLPNRASAYYFRGRRLAIAEQWKAAKVHFEQALRQYNMNATIHLALVEAHLALGEREEAIIALEAGLIVLPDNALLAENLGRLQQGKVEQFKIE